MTQSICLIVGSVWGGEELMSEFTRLMLCATVANVLDSPFYSCYKDL